MVLAARDARLPRRSAGHRERAVGARSARAAAREAAGGRPGAPALSRRALRFPVAARAVGVLRRRARARSCRTAGWSTPAARSSCRTCACANGATSTRSSRARSPSSGWTVGRRSCRRRSTRRATRRSTRRCSPACSATSACKDRGRRRATTARAASASTCIPARGSRKKGAKWVLAAELTETTRLYARCAAKIEPEWIEAVAGDRVTRDYFEPHWDDARGEVVAERARAALRPHAGRAAARVVRRASIPPAAREVFIREALVPGALAHARRVPRAQPAAGRRGRGARAQGAAAGRAGRRRDDRRVLRRARAGRTSHSLATFERWREDAERSDPQLLLLTRETLMRHAAQHVTEELFPETLAMAGATLPLKYRFAPGHPLDGLTLTVPLALLNQLDAARARLARAGHDPREGHVVPEGAAEGVAQPRWCRCRMSSPRSSKPCRPGATRCPTRCASYLAARLGEAPPADVWDGVALPPHLACNVARRRRRGHGAGVGPRPRGAARAAGRSGAAVVRAGRRRRSSGAGSGRWDFGDLPETLTQRAAAASGSPAIPALVDDGDSVSLALARHARRGATRRRAPAWCG